MMRFSIISHMAEPEWLPTQAYKHARIEVQFTDTSGAPLEGAIAAFGVSFHDGYRADISSALFSNSEGKGSQWVEFGRCEGGTQARDFVEYSRAIIIRGEVTTVLEVM